MKNTLLLLIAALFLTGCVKQAEGTMDSSNDKVAVEKLFTADQCTVYRFYDDGDYHYYSKCIGALRSEVETTLSRSCGKSCTESYPDTIVTN